MKITFRFPGFRKDQVQDLPITYKGDPVGEIIHVEEDEDGLIITGQFKEGIDYHKLFIHPQGGYSMGPFSTGKEMMEDYSVRDVELTSAIYSHYVTEPEDEMDEKVPWSERPLSPARGCLFGLLFGAGFWGVVLFILWWTTRG